MRVNIYAEEMTITNPTETLLAAARMAERPCKLIGRVCQHRAFEDGIACEHCFTIFNPYNNPADAYALWKKLAERGVVIRKIEKGWTIRIGDGAIPEIFKTDIDAMLAAVEVMEGGL